MFEPQFGGAPRSQAGVVHPPVGAAVLAAQCDVAAASGDPVQASPDLGVAQSVGVGPVEHGQLLVSGVDPVGSVHDPEGVAACVEASSHLPRGLSHMCVVHTCTRAILKFVSQLRRWGAQGRAVRIAAGASFTRSSTAAARGAVGDNKGTSLRRASLPQPGDHGRAARRVGKVTGAARCAAVPGRPLTGYGTTGPAASLGRHPSVRGVVAAGPAAPSERARRPTAAAPLGSPCGVHGEAPVTVRMTARRRRGPRAPAGPHD